jgi:hypothetical protein
MEAGWRSSSSPEREDLEAPSVHGSGIPLPRSSHPLTQPLTQLPMQPVLTQPALSSKRPALSEIQQEENAKKARPNGNGNSIGAKLFAGIAADVEDFETFSYGIVDDDIGKVEPVAPQELEWLIQSIPLEDRARGTADVNDTIMVLALFESKTGGHDVEM